VLWNGCGW